MTLSRFAASLIVVSSFTGRIPLCAQELTLPSKAEQEAIAKVNRLLDEPVIDTKNLPKEMPLAKLLEAMEKQLPQAKRITLRIDPKAFGAKFGEVARTPITIRHDDSERQHLRWLLTGVLQKIRGKADYRVGSSDITITTPQQAFYTLVYDIGDLVEKQELLNVTDNGWKGIPRPRSRSGDPIRRAAKVLQLVISFSGPKNPGQETMELMNETHLLVRAGGARHAEIASTLALLRRMLDLAVIVDVRAYEVDHAFHKKVCAAKRLYGEALEEQEQLYIKGKLPVNPLASFLEKQKPALRGKTVKLDNGQEAVVLSWHKVTTCLPAPAQIRSADDPPQAVLEGVSFIARVRVSPDRRFVRMTLTEAADELKGLSEIKCRLPLPGAEKLTSELPIVDEEVYSRPLEIPDGGSVIVPVHYRPPTVKARARWWVLSITPRIYIEEEEEQIRKGQLQPIRRP